MPGRPGFPWFAKKEMEKISKRCGLILAVLLPVLFQSCAEKGIDPNAGVQFMVTEVGPQKSNQWLKVRASGEWSLILSAEDMQEGESISWARLETTGGSGDAAVLFSWDENKETTPRSCYVEMTTAGKKYVCDFTQNCSDKSYTEVATELVSDPVPGWMELPAVVDDPQKGMFFISHHMTVKGNVYRNYSFNFDRNKRVAHWVAYPLNSKLIGSGDRTNSWGVLDPKVPRADQAYLRKSFSGYDRGHQLPSADRYSANVSTFYGTNMTPQKAALNQHGWMKLEGKVRSWMSAFDTLYVVTGADVRQTLGTSSDSDGKAIAIPQGYYKALLGYVRPNSPLGTPANSGTTGGWAGIAFYYSHISSGENWGEDDAAIMSHKMSIDELESELGIDFFPLLPSRTQSADKVESTVDSWWK